MFHNKSDIGLTLSSHDPSFILTPLALLSHYILNIFNKYISLADSCENRLGCDVNARCVYDPSRSDSVCQCVDGFEGDGRFCTPRNAQAPIVRPPEHNQHKAECRDQTECHQNAHCIQSESNQRYYCECLPGFRGDGVQSCVSADQCNPSTPNSCNAHAECVYGYAEQAYVCKCIQGFSGDGVRCTAHAQATTCDQEPNICHHNAECSFDVKASRYECKCKPGSTGDGYQSCVIESGCYENRSLCHENAQCILGEHGHYVCNCKYGYHGNGLVCHRKFIFEKLLLQSLIFQLILNLVQTLYSLEEECLSSADLQPLKSLEDNSSSFLIKLSLMLITIALRKESTGPTFPVSSL